MSFPMRHEVAENRARKGLIPSRILVPVDVRCSCLKCGGVARRYDSDNGQDGSRVCIECGFEWEVENGFLQYKSETRGILWRYVPEGLMLVLWEKEI